MPRHEHGERRTTPTWDATLCRATPCPLHGRLSRPSYACCSAQHASDVCTAWPYHRPPHASTSSDCFQAAPESSQDSCNSRMLSLRCLPATTARIYIAHLMCVGPLGCPLHLMLSTPVVRSPPYLRSCERRRSLADRQVTRPPTARLLPPSQRYTRTCSHSRAALDASDAIASH